MMCRLLRQAKPRSGVARPAQPTAKARWLPLAQKATPAELPVASTTQPAAARSTAASPDSNLSGGNDASYPTHNGVITGGSFGAPVDGLQQQQQQPIAAMDAVPSSPQAPAGSPTAATGACSDGAASSLMPSTQAPSSSSSSNTLSQAAPLRPAAAAVATAAEHVHGSTSSAGGAAGAKSKPVRSLVDMHANLISVSQDKGASTPALLVLSTAAAAWDVLRGQGADGQAS